MSAVESSVLRQRLSRLLKERAQLEQDLLERRQKLARGSLYKRYLPCAYAGCKCQQGQLHGPFYYMSDKKEGKAVHRYVGKTLDVPSAKKLIRYKAFQEALSRIRKLSFEISDLWNEYRDSLVEQEG